MKTSDAIAEIAAALAKAQGEIQNPTKTKQNPHFRSSYADLAGGLDVIRPALSKHGIAFVQPTSMEGELVVVHTRLMHTSGQWIEGTYPVTKLGKHQDMMSALTYSKRAALFAIVGVAGEDDDDDGNSAGTIDKASTPRKSSASVKRENPEAWPTLEKDVRTATTREELTETWKRWHDQYETWPASWREQADELFMTRAADIAPREVAAE